MNSEEMRDLLSMEYSKGRYDTITKTIEWLDDNFCEWPNEPKRVEGFFDTLEEMKEDFKKFLNTLEVKEVDLKIAIDKWIDDTAITHEDCSVTDVISTAKYFFELGLKAQKGEQR